MQTDRLGHFDEGARNVMALAQEEARLFNHNYIGTEHLLLGLVREDQGFAAKALDSLGVNLTKVRSAVEFIIGRGERQVMGDIGLTPRAKKVIELAVDESKKLGHDYVGTEHILLGLIREGEGIAAGVLESLGCDLEKVRVTVLRLLGNPEPVDTPQRSPRRVPPSRRAWQYLALPIVRGESRSYVVPSYEEEDILVDLVGQSLEEAMQRLIKQGWVLASADPTFQSREGPGKLYVFKRPRGA